MFPKKYFFKLQNRLLFHAEKKYKAVRLGAPGSVRAPCIAVSSLIFVSKVYPQYEPWWLKMSVRKQRRYFIVYINKPGFRIVYKIVTPTIRLVQLHRIAINNLHGTFYREGCTVWPYFQRETALCPLP